jgi:crotonobetainyl-CoA:carnitine CoA-transferase CaiB-like acyl-CoA transferase
LCEVLGEPGWATEERFATNAQRVRNIDVLSSLLRERLGRWQRKALIEALDRAGVPCGPINDLAEVFDEPQVKARALLRHAPHPAGVDVPQVANPMRFGGAALPLAGAPPLLGQHSEEILAGIGYAPADIASLRRAGVV